MKTWPLPALLAALGAACSVHLLDPRGRACDEDHPCGGGRVCFEGYCVAPDGVPPDLDAGPGADGGCVADAPCAAGEGECRRQGVTSCSSGSPLCTAVAGAPSPEVCDGLDNDCDGRPDVSREALLAASDGGVALGQLSWVGHRGGLAAVYQRVGSADDVGLLFRRFTAALAAQGAPSALGEPAGRAPHHPSLVAQGDGVALAWADEISTGTPRVVLTRLGADGKPLTGLLDGGQGPAFRVFAQEASDGRVNLSLSNDGQYLLASWAGAEQLVAATLRADGTVYRAPSALTDGGVRVREVASSPLGHNDQAVAFTGLEAGNGERVRFVRVLETVQLGGALASRTAAGPVASLQVVPVPNPDAGAVNEQVAGAWIDHDPSQAMAPRVEALGATGSAGVTTLAAADAGSWSVGLVATPRGPWAVWLQAEDGRLLARAVAGGSVVDLTPPGSAGRSCPVGSAPALAYLDGGVIAVGYAATKPGGGTSLYGQTLCLP